MTNVFSKHALSFPTALCETAPPKQRHTPMRWDWTALPTDCVELILKFADAWQLQFWKDCYFDVWAQQISRARAPLFLGSRFHLKDGSLRTSGTCAWKLTMVPSDCGTRHSVMQSYLTSRILCSGIWTRRDTS